MDDLDRLLAREDAREPSGGFSARVMGAVRREAATPPPLRFPWRRLVAGLAAALLWLALGYRLLVQGETLDLHGLAASWEAMIVAGLVLSLALARAARLLASA